MYRNVIGASSALALLALLAGTPATGLAHDGAPLCNVILDGDGEPVLEADSDDIAHSNSSECADGDASARVENVDGEQETAAATPAPAPAAAEPLTVYFDTGEKDVSAEGRAEVAAYVADLMATSPRALTVVGYTDTSGPADLNARLSEWRANSVSAALIEAGVPAGMITRGASGEQALAVETPDDTREASNRRVTVTPSY